MVTLLGPKRNGERVVGKVSSEQRLDNGVWEFRYTAKTSGEYLLKIALNGYNIPGSPFKPYCDPVEICVEECLCKGRGLSGLFYTGHVAQFYIVSRDVFGNKLLGGGHEFSVRVLTHRCVRPPSTPPPVNFY
jgi:hypothetical protein